MSSGDFWLAGLFAAAMRAPWLLPALRPFGIRAAPYFAPRVRHNIAANIARLRLRPLSPAESQQAARAVFENFYDFVADVAQLRHATVADIRSRIESIDGRESYVAARKSGRGAVLLTAHLGSFEAGLVALMDVESPEKVHVVFKRDAFSSFERLRADLRNRLGVRAIAIDNAAANPILMLRDALARNEVIVLQADRALPGQRSQAVPFLGGTLQLPAGPFTLARIHNSPLIPVFSLRTPAGFRVVLHDPIPAEDPQAIHHFASVLAQTLAAHPEQWLVLHRAFLEDQAAHPS